MATWKERETEGVTEKGIGFWDTWIDRTRLMRQWIDDDARSVLDLGAGNMRLRTMLPDGTAYYPVHGSKKSLSEYDVLDDRIDALSAKESHFEASANQRFVDMDVRLDNEIKNLRRQLSALERWVNRLEKITGIVLLRVVYKFYRCLRGKGLAYTIKRIQERLLHRHRCT